MTKTDAVRKVKALLDLSTSSNENEASAALAKAQRMMIEWEIASDEVEKKTMTSVVVPFLSSVQTWEVTLATSIAVYFNTKASYSKYTREFQFWGSSIDVEIASFAFISTRNRLLELLTKQRRLAYENPKAFRTSWLLGAAIGISSNLQQASKFDRSDAVVHALVQVKGAAAESFMMEQNLTIRSREIDTSFASSNGFSNGRDVGSNLNIVRGLK